MTHRIHQGMVAAGCLATALGLMWQTASAAPIPTPARSITDPHGIESPAVSAAKPLGIDAVFRSAQSYDGAITPDGTDLVYSADTTGRFNLWRVSLAGGAATQLTTSNERQLWVTISPDSATVVYGQDSGGAEMFDLYAVPRAGGAPVNLTDTPDASEMDAVFSADGRHLAYSQRLRTAASANVVVMDLSTRKTHLLTDERAPDRQWSVVAFSGDGRTVYASRANVGQTESTLWKIDVETRRAAEVIRGSKSKLNSASDVSPDGRFIALTTETAAGATQAALYDVAARRMTLLAPGPWEQAPRKFTKDGRTLLFVSKTDGRSVIYRYDLKTRRAAELVLPPGVNDDYIGNLPAITADGTRIVFPHQTGTRSIDYWVQDLATGRASQLTHLAGADPSVPDTRIVTYESFDGTRISAILWVPANAARNGKNSAVLIAHGGPTGQTEDRYDADAVALASRGYFVIAPNPRGSTGYGREFMRANVRDLGGGDLQDYVAGARFLVDSGYVDATRIGIAGTSYGGYMTMIAIGRAPDVFAAGVETCGITNWTSMYERGSPALRAYQEGLIGHPERDRDVYSRVSPLTYLDKVKAPLLVLQGENDIRVPKFEAEQVAATLTKFGRTVEAQYYAGEGHGLFKRESQVDALERTIGWFDRYLKRETAGLDSLQWLETPKSPRALAWAREQTERSARILEQSPSYAPILGGLRTALTTSAAAVPVSLLGKRAVRLLRDVSHPHGLLQVASYTRGSLGPWRGVLDVDALRKKEGSSIELQWSAQNGACAPPEYSRCLMRLSPGGGDGAEMREFDLERGEFVAGGFHVPATRLMASFIDSDHVLIAHALAGTPLTAAGWGAAVHLWARGTPLETASVVFTAPSTDALVEVSRIGSGTGARGVILRVPDFSTYEFKLVDVAGHVQDVPLPRKVKAFGLLGVTDKHLVVQLTEPWDLEGQRLPAETLVAYDVTRSTHAASPIYVPKDGEFLNDTFFGFAATRSAVHFVLTRALIPRLVTATPTANGWSVRDAARARVGESLHVSGAADGGDALVLETAGFLTPARQEIQSPGARPILVYQEPAAFDASRFVVERRTAQAADATAIDYFLLRPKSVTLGRPVPTLMTGYGAFGVSLTPGYLDFEVGGRGLTVWLDHGGALAIPAIRGGGERGEAWHQAAMRERRLVSYGDFAAVAQDLISSGFTAPAHLGVFGTSNGGLLSATMGLQRPDLFGAVVSDVPLTDMLRFPQMGMGGAWTEEYGDPNDPAIVPVLRSYSPLHLVQNGVKYPPFLISISTEDNRVGPGHARKLAARLLEAGSTVYFIEDQEGGHGVSDSLARPEVMAERLTFLITTLMPK